MHSFMCTFHHVIRHLPDRAFDKLKARLIAGDDQQDKTLSDDLSSATVATSSVSILAAVAVYEYRTAAVVDIGMGRGVLALGMGHLVRQPALV